MSRRPDEQGSIFSCQATLPRAGTYFLKEPNAARQALLHGTDSWLVLSSAKWASGGAARTVSECMTSRAHNASFRHFDPPSKNAASFQWASFGTFPLGSIGKAIGFHASSIARWWHKPVLRSTDRLVFRAATCLTTTPRIERGNIILCHPR